jgi:hypothetical protein
VNKREQKKLHLSLADLIKDWLNMQAEEVALPYIGKETAYYMAAAAMAVFEAAEDIHVSLEEDGELREQAKQ